MVEQQTGCLGLVLALILGLGTFFVLGSASGSVEATPAPMMVPMPAPSTPAP